MITPITDRKEKLLLENDALETVRELVSKEGLKKALHTYNFGNLMYRFDQFETNNITHKQYIKASRTKGYMQCRSRIDIYRKITSSDKNHNTLDQFEQFVRCIDALDYLIDTEVKNIKDAVYSSLPNIVDRYSEQELTKDIKINYSRFHETKDQIISDYSRELSWLRNSK
jgi:hypothetical protein